ncbi:MAG: hypothetical protein AB8B84_08950 [Granulosicoccus sp.]
MNPPFPTTGASRCWRVQKPRATTAYRLFKRTTALFLIINLSGCQAVSSETITPNVHSINRVHSARANTPLNSEQTAVQTFRETAFVYGGSWSENIDEMFVKARELVEQKLETNLEHVTLKIVDNKPINEEVSRESHRLIQAQFGDNEFARHFLSKVMDAQVGTYAALFTSKTNSIMVSQDMLSSFENSLPADESIRTSALMTLLIHELVHAADDQRYKIHENRALNFRASFAQSATFEGHAQWITRKICEQHNCSEGLDALDNFMFNRNAEPALHSQPIEAISHNVLEYSYVEGERFIAALAERENGQQLIDELLSAPPQDPIQILSPETFPDKEREIRNQRLISASLDVDHAWVKGSWIGVETSPLKGVNLRSDPEQREAAIDGFTRLINSMVSMQFYDQDRHNSKPMEVTVLQTDTARTATLFARTLHDNASVSASRIDDESVVVKSAIADKNSDIKAHIYRSEVSDSAPYRTTIAVSGNYLVQISGETINSSTQDDYAVRVLLNLQLGKLRI